jgi:chloramphenicol-sensitive protein RarD
MPSDSSKQGALYAISAYTLWGIAPIYFKLLTHIEASITLGHRVIWSCVFIALLLLFSRQWRKVIAVLKNPKHLATLCVTSLLIGVNWLIFIWAVNNDRLLDASLGYFINPLLNVVLAVVFLGERFRPVQWLAVMLAGGGVAIQIFNFGAVPWIAITLALTFGFYGLLRKKVNLDALPGLFIETGLLLPLALIYMALYASQHAPTESIVLLALSGIVTTLPLLAFGAAATRLKLSTLSFFQYIGPSIMFLLATLLYGESLDNAKLVVFAFIWAALVLFSWEGINYQKRRSV